MVKPYSTEIRIYNRKFIMLYLPLRTNSGQGWCFHSGHLFYFYLTATYCFRKCLYAVEVRSKFMASVAPAPFDQY